MRYFYLDNKRTNERLAKCERVEDLFLKIATCVPCFINGLVYLFQCRRLIRSELGMLFRRLYIWVGRFILVSASDLKRTWYVVRAIVYMACLVVNPITVTSFRLSSLIAGKWVRLQTL